ncbi:MAG TPA: ISNCY family transposase, partial [Bryobacteraceae bacterium]
LTEAVFTASGWMTYRNTGGRLAQTRRTLKTILRPGGYGDDIFGPYGIEDGEITQQEAAEKLGISYRQTKRLVARYRERGAGGLAHGDAGRRSNRAKPEKFHRKVLKLVRKEYQGPGEVFGPTLAAEHLEQDHQLKIDPEALRRWMLEEGLWTRQRKRQSYRQRRKRRAHFGELLQMDGSFHAWFEERGPRGCPINLVDDATSTVLARLFEEETTWAVAHTLRAWVEKYGIPRALYVDWKNVYHHQATERQKREGEIPLSQFQRMCQKLGIELIGANSPQAKGRVERSHGTHQDRLIKKMRRKKLHSYEAANRYLEQTYLSEHNRRFAVDAAQSVDFHEAVPTAWDLEEVFCLEEERSLSPDWVVQYKNRWLQIPAEPAVPAGSKIVVRERFDGSLHLWWKATKLSFSELQHKPEIARPQAPKTPRKAAVNIPASDHPWRKPFLSKPSLTSAAAAQ